jgi:outer membrane lipoprotein-sorting protein
MTRRICLSILCFAALAAPAKAQSADELVDKYVAALGGREKLKALQTIRLTATSAMGAMSFSMTMTKSRPNLVRLDSTISGATMVQGYDGTTAWQLVPQMGETIAHPVSGTVEEALREDAEFDPWPLDYRTRGTVVEFVGRETVDNTPAYRLKVTRRIGAEISVWLDASTFLEIQSESARDVAGQHVVSQTISSKFEKVDGLTFPMRVETRNKEQAGGQGNVTVFTRVELNPKIDPSIFKMPGT